MAASSFRPDSQPVSTQQLARLLGVSTRQVWRRLAEGWLPPPVRRGRPCRWDLTAIVAHVAEHSAWESCRLAGQAAYLRAYQEQQARVLGWITDPLRDERNGLGWRVGELRSPYEKR